MKILTIFLSAFFAISTTYAQQPFTVVTTKKQHTIDSLYRDSLIKVATTYKIPMGITDDYNPTVYWLFSVINSKEYSLKKGKSYNTYIMTDVVKLIIANLPTKYPSYINGKLIFYIDNDGEIVDVSSFGTSNISEELMFNIQKTIKGKKIPPFTFNNKNYKSYKVFTLDHWPLRELFELTEVGEDPNFSFSGF